LEGDPEPNLNLFDLSQGNYTIARTITYPDYPRSKIETNAQVKATREAEWDTNITINGTYDGPMDVASIRDYQATWTSDGKGIRELGSATLVLKSGGNVRQIWESTITPERGVSRFPKTGERINVSIAQLQIDVNKMSYSWEGTVRAQSK
jgi:hypothetical protein